MTEATLFLPGLSPVGGKTITATFDGGKLSSNGGVLILREIERKLGLAAVLSRHIPDDRDRMRITHSYSDMTRARMFAIASGHEDCDDLDVLRSDPALKMACGRLPVSGTDLMSQPTLSRLENAPFWRQLARMGLELIDLFCARFERVPRCIVLDIDDTDDAVHGQQQLALFNTHAGGYCFQPIQIFEATTGRPVLSLLRPGKRPSGEEVSLGRRASQNLNSQAYQRVRRYGRAGVGDYRLDVIEAAGARAPFDERWERAFLGTVRSTSTQLEASHDKQQFERGRESNRSPQH